MSNILITGGAGAIGSRLAARLLDDGNRVTVLDDLSSGFAENLCAGLSFVDGSVTDQVLLKDLFDSEGYDFIFHLAALFANQNSVEHPEDDLEINAMGTLRLLEQAQRASQSARLKRLVYVSSSCIYGTLAGPAVEDSPARPETPYAITKLMGEHYVRFFFEHYKIPITTVRLFNSYGPGERPGRYRNVIPNLIQLALDGDPLTITGTGNETRDFTYVDDVVECLVQLSVSGRSLGDVYNIGTGKETKIRELVEQIIALTGSVSEVRFSPRRAWDQVTRRCADVSKVKTHLGFGAKTPLSEGLAATIRWISSLTG